jgi:FkbM family methyltransferase
MIAEGAGTFRKLTALERLARRVSRVPLGGTVRASLKRAYLGLLEAQTGGAGLTATLPGGEQVRVLPEFSYLGWNPDEYHAFKAAIRPGGIALDVGANAGAYTLLLAQWVGAAGRVVAFEPSRAAFDALVRHIHLNQVGEIASPLCIAVGERQGVAGLVEPGPLGASRLAGAGDSGSLTTVPTVSIDAFCAAERLAPDFIKIDIEGWELAALRGARQTIHERGKALALFVELHPSVWPRLGVTRAAFEAELDEQALDLITLTPHVDPWTVEGICVRLQPRR